MDNDVSTTGFFSMTLDVTKEKTIFITLATRMFLDVITHCVFIFAWN